MHCAYPAVSLTAFMTVFRRTIEVPKDSYFICEKRGKPKPRLIPFTASLGMPSIDVQNVYSLEGF